MQDAIFLYGGTRNIPAYCVAIGCRLTPKPRPRHDADSLTFLSLLLPGG